MLVFHYCGAFPIYRLGGRHRNAGIQRYRNTREGNADKKERGKSAVFRFSITGGLSNTERRGILLSDLHLHHHRHHRRHRHHRHHRHHHHLHRHPTKQSLSTS